MIWQKNEVKVTVISDGTEDFMTEFSEHNSVHNYLVNGVIMKAPLLFYGEGRYAGPIVVYVTEEAEFFIEPDYQFKKDYTQCL